MKKNFSRLELMPHNVPLYEKLEAKMAEENARTLLISATGTGKSYVVGLFLQTHAKRPLIVVPRDSLVVQWKRLVKATVITYHTYARRTARDAKGYLSHFDVVVFDEAHHLGAPKWGGYIPANKKVIGLTADPIRYLDGMENIAETVFHGNVIMGLELYEAIRLGILPGFDYVSSMYGLKSYNPDEKLCLSKEAMSVLKTYNYNVENQYQIEALMDLYAPNHKKGIVFCNKISEIPEAQRMIQRGPQYVMHSKLSSAQNRATLNAFWDADEGWLFTVGMVIEGDHIPGTTCGVMFRRTSSPNLYMQQMGRLLAPGNENVVIFDFVGNSYNLKFHRAKMDEMKRRYAPSDRPRDPVVDDRVLVHDYTVEALDLLDQLERFFSCRWDVRDDAILFARANEPAETLQKAIPHRSVDAISRRLKALGLRADARKPAWSDADRELLWENAYESVDTLQVLFPTHSLMDIYYELRQMQVENHGMLQAAREWAEWSAAGNEMDQLNFQWDSRDMRTMFPGRTAEEIHSRLSILGIHDPNSWEEDDMVLLANAGKSAALIHSLIPWKTREAIEARCEELGINHHKTHRMTSAERQLFKAHAAEGLNALKMLFPDLSDQEILDLAKRYGVYNYVSNRNAKKEWTAEEDAVLYKYPTLSLIALKEMLPDRGTYEIGARRRALNLTAGSSARAWSKEEEAIIRENYPRGRSVLYALLPHRTPGSIDGHIHRMKLAVNTRRPGNHAGRTYTMDFWSPEEDSILADNLAKTYDELEKLLPKRTYAAIRHRLEYLGLKKQKGNKR